MASRNHEPLSQNSLILLAEKLGYEFTHWSLLTQALTHRSFSRTNNERLEFLGDSIVNFVIGEALFHQFPQAQEGQLSRLRARLVKGPTLAELAREFEVGNYLRLGTGEIKSGGTERESILADTFEAIIGAIYLDAGFIATQQIILQWYTQRLKAIEITDTLKDPKTRLQEWLQAQQLELPHYEVMSIAGEAHAQIFNVLCFVPGLNKPTQGKGASRRFAEQQAAECALAQLMSQHNDENL